MTKGAIMRLVLASSILVAVRLCSNVSQRCRRRRRRKSVPECQQCHRIGVGATNFYGPVLNGLIGRKAASVPGYKYSEALEKSDIVWNDDTLVEISEVSRGTRCPASR